MWVVGAVVLTLVVVFVAIRKDLRAVHLSLVSNASALCLGAGIGFLILAVVSEKGIVYGLSAKWLIGGCILTVFMFRALRCPATEDEAKATLPPSPLDELKDQLGVSSDEELSERIASLSKEEQQHICMEIDAYLDRTILEVENFSKAFNRKVMIGYILAGLGLVVLIASFWVK